MWRFGSERFRTRRRESSDIAHISLWRVLLQSWLIYIVLCCIGKTLWGGCGRKSTDGGFRFCVERWWGFIGYI